MTNIPNRLLEVAEGLRILAPYCGALDIMTGHDYVGAGPNTLETVSVEDQAKLKALHWYYANDGGDSQWVHYV